MTSSKTASFSFAVFFLVSLLASSALASSSVYLNGTIYLDCNGNGVYDNQEKPLPNIKVFASDDATGKNISTTVSTPTGAFSFYVAQNDQYNLCASLPSSEYFFTIPSSGCLSVTVKTSSIHGLLIGVNEVLEIIAPSDKTVECTATTNPGETGFPVTKNCPTSTVTLSFADVVSYPCQGSSVTTRTWTAIAGTQIASAVQVIQSVDNTSPSFTSFPADITVECTANISPINVGAPTSTDECATPSNTFHDANPTGGSCSKTIQRTWKAQDPCGNFATEIQQITEVDTIPPTFVSFPSNVTVPNGSSTDPSATGTPVIVDACTSASLSFSDASSSVSQGTLITRTWTASDACGNRRSLPQKITVLSA